MFISFIISMVFLWVATQLYLESEWKATKRMEKNTFYFLLKDVLRVEDYETYSLTKPLHAPIFGLFRGFYAFYLRYGGFNFR